jgi:predicted Rossmann fold nucleotide-binding protein DprA/Smf involved in DNA uptake
MNYASADSRPESEALMALCDGKPLHIDRIADCVTCSRRDLVGALLLLGLKSRVRRLPGDMYQRCDLEATNAH